MKLQKSKIQLQNGIDKPVYVFTLTNDNGVRIKISNYGGIISDIKTPDKNGKLSNICLGFGNFSDYFSDVYVKANPYFGAIIGRYANRIAGGSFAIDGLSYSLSKNETGNTLHGGQEGFDKKVWDFETLTAPDSVTLILKRTSPDGEEGFPGELDVKVIYKLNAGNELSINYLASANKKTHLNLTNHTYFNLSGRQSDVLDHEVTIYADRYLEMDAQNIPTGKSKHVSGTPLDFRKEAQIGKRISELAGEGYDHCVELNNYNRVIRKVAKAIHPESGRLLEVFTSEPGLQFYTGNFLDGSLVSGKRKYSKWSGFCFETQHYPDSPNQPAFPTTLLNPGVLFDSTTFYKFGLA